MKFVLCREAEATRTALHGVQWPVGNGKKLIIEYATTEELEKAKNPPAPPAPAVPVIEEPKIPEKENEVSEHLFFVFSMWYCHN